MIWTTSGLVMLGIGCMLSAAIIGQKPIGQTGLVLACLGAVGLIVAVAA